MCGSEIEGDGWEWALTSIAGAHRAAGPAGHALRSLAKDSCSGVCSLSFSFQRGAGSLLRIPHLPPAVWALWE